MKKQRLLVGVGALLGGLVSLAIGWLFIFRPLLIGHRVAPRPVEHVEEVRKEVAEAFGPKAPLAEGDVKASLQAFFDELGAALQAQDPVRVGPCIDTRRMMKEFRRAGLLPGMTPRQEEQFHARFAASAPGGFAQQGQVLHWTLTEIRSVKFLDDPDEALVIARHRVEGVATKMRWWVRREGGRWRFYDCEDLDTAIRVSTVVGSLVPNRDLQFPEWVKAAKWIQPASNALITGNLDEAERILDGIPAVQFPPQIEALRWLFRGLVKLQRQQDAEAVACFDRVRALNVEMPCLDRCYGIAYLGVGQPEKSLTHLRKYHDLFGDDSDTCHYLGVALARLGKPGEAAIEFRKSLDDNKEADGSLAELAKVLPAGQKGELADRFAQMVNPDPVFDHLVGEAFKTRDTEAVEIYVAEMRRRKSTAPVVDFCLARARALQGRAEEALPLFTNAIARMPNDQTRKDYVGAFLRDVANAGKPLEGYRVAPVPRDAFAVIAQELLVQRNLVRLRELIDVHRQRHREDVWLRYYQGQIYLNERAYAKAEEEFAAAWAQPLDAAARERFREVRVYGRYMLGKWRTAYDEIGPPRATFAQLALLFAQANDGKQLAELVALHRRADAADPNLPLWQTEAHWLGRDYEAAVRLLREHRDTVFADKAQRSKFWYRLIYSLARLKRADEVRKEVETLARDVSAGGKELTFLLNDLLRDKQVEAVDLLTAALLKVAPDDPDSTFQRARAELLRERFTEAGRLLRDAIARQQDARKRQDYSTNFLLDAVDVGKPLEGYRVAPDPDAAFRLLAEELLNDIFDASEAQRFPVEDRLNGKRELPILKDDLRRLIEAHRKNRPDDALLHLYAGELHRVEGRYDKAEEAFAAGMSQPLNEEMRQRFQHLRVFARYKAGKGLSAYADFEPRRQVFDHLAGLFLADKDGRGLEALVAAHRKADPKDDSLPVWEAEARWLAGDYAAVVKLLHEHRKGAFADRKYQWKFQDRLVRSLARLKRFDEALQEAQAIAADQFANPLLVAVVHALAGDVPKTGAALGECMKRYDATFSFYADPDLGPILRSEPFRALRERYPEPKRPGALR